MTKRQTFSHRKSSVTQANQSQIISTFDPAHLQLDTETIRYDLDHNGTYEFSRTLDRSRDPILRDSGFQLLAGPSIENQATYTYSATDGRLASVAGASSDSFQYGYVPNSNLIQTVTGPNGTNLTVIWDKNWSVEYSRWLAKEIPEIL